MSTNVIKKLLIKFRVQIWLNICVLYTSTNVWVLCTPNTGRNMHFQHFLCLRFKRLFRSNHDYIVIIKDETIHYRLSQFNNYRTNYIQWIHIHSSHKVIDQCYKQLLSTKNIENIYFDQRLECAAPNAGQNIQYLCASS